MQGYHGGAAGAVERVCAAIGQQLAFHYPELDDAVEHISSPLSCVTVTVSLICVQGKACYAPIAPSNSAVTFSQARSMRSHWDKTHNIGHVLSYSDGVRRLI